MNKILQKRCIQLARIISPTIRNLKSSHVAFLIRKSKIIKMGWNKPKTHPKNKHYPYNIYSFTHAELDVINKSKKQILNNCEILVIRIDKNNCITMSKPCKGCLSVIKQFGIKTIYYTNYDGFIDKC